MNVLIVDDSALVRSYHRQILESGGFYVEEAANGLEAYEKALTKNYDLYIVDINMPVLDGYSFVQKLRDTKDLKQSPVIMVSTEQENKDKDMAFRCGANFYIAKPVKPEEFLGFCKIISGVN